MITVTNAGALQGYSGLDHLIEDNTSNIIGLEFRSVSEALRKADTMCFISQHGNHARQNHPYTWIDVMMANGKTHTHKSA